jgi:hypothetical protein
MSTAALSELPQVELAAEQSTLVPASSELFVIMDHFTPKNPLVKIAPFDSSFERFFESVVEGPIADTMIYSRLLTWRMRDGMIFSRLSGGEAKAPLTMRAVYALMLRQSLCQPGYLVTERKANVFYYPPGTNGIRKALSLHATPAGWLPRLNVVVYSSDLYRDSNDYWELGCKIHCGAPFQGQNSGLTS